MRTRYTSTAVSAGVKDEPSMEGEDSEAWVYLDPIEGDTCVGLNRIAVFDCGDVVCDAEFMEAPNEVEAFVLSFVVVLFLLLLVVATLVRSFTVSDACGVRK